jgi:(5-formylfuran-3-yl)methyl phosphate synthase
MLRRALETGPRLLVSVRNAEEAHAALEGGADIIDIKEPTQGSLGKADDKTIAEIVETLRGLNPAIPISAALGELRDGEKVQALSRLPSEVGYVKLGLSACGDDCDWLGKWRIFRRRFCQARSPDLIWVMVLYADWRQANSPHPQELIQAAVEDACGAVLLDTFYKDGRSLLEVLSQKELRNIADAVHATDMPFAVAGSLRKEDLPRLSLLKPDIIAIRSAACLSGRREAAVSSLAVRQFRQQMQHLVYDDSECTPQ